MAEDKERVCLLCGKRLLDKKVPVCLRCAITARNTTGKTVAELSTIIFSIKQGMNFLDSNKKI